MLTAEHLLKIEQDAKQATPGPWDSDGYGVISIGSVVSDVCYVSDFDDVAHIANCDPQTIAELVRMARLGLLVSEKFASGNSVPVERIAIKRDEYQAIAESKD